MSPRERVLRAMRRQVPDKVPKTAGFTPRVMEVFKEKTGSDDPARYFGWEPRGVGWKPTTREVDWRAIYKEELPENTAFDELGHGHSPGGFYHFVRYHFPMAHMTAVAEAEEYPWPDIEADYRHDHLEDATQRLRDAGYFVGGGVGHIFEDTWQLVGWEKLLQDMVINPEFAAYLYDKITGYRCFMARRYAEAGCDMLHLGDDVGMQDRLMMSPDAWRKWLKPRLARVIKAGRDVKPDIHAFYHSDGNIESIIPDLIEVGVDILNPVQPECMDPLKLKKQYGDRLSFWGTIGTQSVMPFGTPDNVRRTVKHMIETVGAGGGLLIAPTHVLEPDVPWENIVALFEAVEEYGTYTAP